MNTWRKNGTRLIYFDAHVGTMVLWVFADDIDCAIIVVVGFRGEAERVDAVGANCTVDNWRGSLHAVACNVVERKRYVEGVADIAPDVGGVIEVRVVSGGEGGRYYSVTGGESFV